MRKRYGLILLILLLGAYCCSVALAEEPPIDVQVTEGGEASEPGGEDAPPAEPTPTEEVAPTEEPTPEPTPVPTEEPTPTPTEEVTPTGEPAEEPTPTEEATPTPAESSENPSGAVAETPTPTPMSRADRVYLDFLMEKDKVEEDTEHLFGRIRSWIFVREADLQKLPGWLRNTWAAVMVCGVCLIPLSVALGILLAKSHKENRKWVRRGYWGFCFAVPLMITALLLLLPSMFVFFSNAF